MKRIILALTTAAALTLTGCAGSPGAEPAPAPTTSQAAETSAPAPTPAAVAEGPDVAEGPGDNEHAYYTFVNNLQAEDDGDEGLPPWMGFVNGAEDDGTTLNLYTRIPPNAFDEDQGRENWDIDGICMSGMWFGAAMEEAGQKTYEEVWVMDLNGDPLEICDINAMMMDEEGGH